MSATTTALECPDCGVQMRLKDSRYGYFFGCPNWPGCEVTVGCHPGTTKPLGTPAGPETKAARIRAHDTFDALWKGPGATMRRKDAYRWLADALGLSPEDCHIGMFDAETCERVVDAVNKRKRRTDDDRG